MTSASVRALLVLSLVGSAVHCGGGGAPPAVEPKAEESKEKKLDCAFAHNVENCWRTATAKVAACLGGKPSAPGKLQKDDATMCLLPDQVAVKLGAACDPDGKCEVRDLFLGKGDKKCAEIHGNVERPASEEGRGAGSLEITFAGGSVKLDYDEKTKKVTCPDGTVYAGTGDWKKELADCADESGYQGIPAWSTTVTPSKKDGKKKIPGKVAVEVASMETLFECEKP
jgi:hypothetical protein